MFDREYSIMETSEITFIAPILAEIQCSRVFVAEDDLRTATPRSEKREPYVKVAHFGKGKRRERKCDMPLASRNSPT